MKRLMISAVVGLGLFAAATTALRSNSASSIRTTNAMPPVQDLQADTSKLPVAEYEDRSLVYPNIPQR
jgi:hypothetical protein